MNQYATEPSFLLPVSVVVSSGPASVAQHPSFVIDGLLERQSYYFRVAVSPTSLELPGVTAQGTLLPLYVFQGCVCSSMISGNPCDSNPVLVTPLPPYIGG